MESMTKNLPTELAKIILPKNEVSKEGQQQIKSLLHDKGYNNYYLDDMENQDKWSWEWVVKGSGDYVGTIPKRIGKLFYKKGNKLSSQILTEIGNIGAENCVKSSNYNLRFTRYINWRPGDYGDGGSCFWQCHSSARYFLMDKEAVAMLFYSSENADWKNHKEGVARCLIYPDQNTNSYFVFNAYGTLKTLECARILSHMLGLLYKKIRFMINRDIDHNYPMDDQYHYDDGRLYFNGSGNNYIVASPKQLEGKEWHNFKFDTSNHQVSYCDSCSHYCLTNLMSTYGGYTYCAYCYEIKVKKCDGCKKQVNNWWIVDKDIVCIECLNNYYRKMENVA